MNPPLSLHSLRPAPSASAVQEPVPDEVLQVLSRSRRLSTPCGEGELVWHLWGEGQARPECAWALREGTRGTPIIDFVFIVQAYFFYPSFIFDRSENSDGIAYFCTHKKNVITRKPSH